MVSNASTEYDPELLEDARRQLATGDDLDPEIFPQLYNVSCGFMFRFVPRPTSITRPEFVYVPFENDRSKPADHDWAKYRISIVDWNLLWETGQLRYDFFERRLPTELSWLARFRDYNLYLLPDTKKPRYDAYAPLFHLLPRRTVDTHGQSPWHSNFQVSLDALQANTHSPTGIARGTLPFGLLEKYHLPLLRKSIWPPMGWRDTAVLLLQDDFEDRLSNAFAHHVWPLLSPGSRIEAFSKDDTMVLLSHNLDYWLPFAYSVAEERLRAFPRVSSESTEQEKELKALQQELPNDMQVDFPLCGGPIWAGEKDSWDATKELVEVADRNGKLRGIIEAVRANRVEDDFSDRWSYAREDFERKLYSKRSKVKVSFVQLDDTMPIHGPYSELDENLLWEDFIGLLDKKERQVVVCLRSGVTKVGEISKILGYANHSPVSKALKRIRQKAKQYFELD